MSSVHDVAWVGIASCFRRYRPRRLSVVEVSRKEADLENASEAQLSHMDCTWFGLPEEIASGLFGSATSRCLKAADTLFQTGDTGDGCYLLNSGVLKVIMTSSQGDERILAILPPGTIVGDLAMIDGLPQSASVVALTDCELLLYQPNCL